MLQKNDERGGGDNSFKIICFEKMLLLCKCHHTTDTLDRDPSDTNTCTILSH